MMTPGKPQSFHRFQLQITRKRFAKGRKETIREKSSATQVRTDSKVFYTVFLIFRSIFHSQQISCRNQHKLLKNMPNGLLLTVLKNWQLRGNPDELLSTVQKRHVTSKSWG
jgi:hypothetical protein